MKAHAQQTWPQPPEPRPASETAPYLAVLPMAALIMTPEGIRYANPAAELMLGASLAQLSGRALSDIFHRDCTLPAMVARVFAENITLRDHEQTVMPLRLPDIAASVTVVPYLREGVVAEVVVLIDHSAALVTQAQTARREVVRAAGTIAAMLAHEVKNPLSGIRGAAQLLAEERAEGDRALPDLICREVERIRELLDRFEFLSELPVSEMDEVNIHEALDDVCALVQDKNIAIEKLYDPSLPPVRARRDLLVQLFLNLLKNASEALGGTGRIKLATSYRGGLRTKLPDGTMCASHIAVTVEDNGPGIAPEIRTTLFEPFVSTKEGSRGLGLAITSKIAADLGGGLELESAEAGATRFCVLLPCTS